MDVLSLVRQIGSNCRELKKMADQLNLPMLAYLLDMAALEDCSQ